jgi:hypothetical protein
MGVILQLVHVGIKKKMKRKEKGLLSAYFPAAPIRKNHDYYQSYTAEDWEGDWIYAD